MAGTAPQSILGPRVSTGSDRLQVDVAKRLQQFEFRCDLNLPLAGLTALFGPSGAGKSTLINLIAGLHRPDEGRVAIGDTVFFDAAMRTELPVHERALGMVFQDARLFPHMTTRRNLMFGLKRAGVRANRPVATFDAVVELLGLASLLEQRPHTLSGGEKQRVAIGRALLAQPRLLLMDEPLASLDAQRKDEVLNYVGKLRDEFNVPILYVSHALDEVLRLATSLVLIDHGRVVASGQVSEVLTRRDVRDRLGGAEFGTLVFGVVSAHDERYGLSTIDCDGFSLRVPRVDLPAGAALRARIPARDVSLTLASPIDVSIINRIEGVVEAVTPLPGPYAEASVRVASSTVIAARITRESADRLALAPGVRVWCLIKSVALDAGALAIAGGRAARPAFAPANDEQMFEPDGSRR
ncbi:MAG: molybdenum ABC transporter ATP-binding protein [Burkholderiaceae bacterium]